MSPGNAASVVPAQRARADTRWSIIRDAADLDSPRLREALATLCGTYWYPLYAYARRDGHTAEQSQDLTQAFFAKLLEKNYWQAPDRRCGSFRSFVINCFRQFLSDERDRPPSPTLARVEIVLSIDSQEAERRYKSEPRHEATSEQLFERSWALTLLDRALMLLRQELVACGHAMLFEHLKVYLTTEARPTTYRQLAEILGMTEGMVKVGIHRLRRRYRELLRDEIAQTVDHPAHIDAEIRDLFAALS